MTDLKKLAETPRTYEVSSRWHRDSDAGWMGRCQEFEELAGTLERECTTLLQEVETLREKLNEITDWTKAYPLKVFPEPDFARAAEVLKAAGITLDSISASNMRHVLRGIEQIVNGALQHTDGER